MNNKPQNKISKVKVMYVRNGNSDEHVQDPGSRKSGRYPRSFRTNGGYRPFRDEKNFLSDNCKPYDHKCDNVLVKADHGDTSDQIFTDPEVLRRQRAKESRVYGENACQALFRNRPDCIVRAWFVQNVTQRFSKTMRWMAASRKAYHVVTDIELDKISGTEHHGGVCFLIKKRNGTTVQQWVRQADVDDCVLALNEDFCNPHNLGAIVRSCAYFGAKGILLQNLALLESGAAIRIAEGGAEHVQPIIANSIVNALKDFRKAGYTVVTTSNYSAIPLFKAVLPRKMVLVLGQEHNVLSGAPFSLIDFSVSINGTENVKSLNLSVMTGLLLGEWWRQNKV